MPSRYRKPDPGEGLLRLAMPEPLFQPIASSDQDVSSPEDVPPEARIFEEDAHSIVGVSMSRVQTRLMSPQTPVAEKAAALAHLEGGGLFDEAMLVDQRMAGATNVRGSEETAEGAEVSSPSTPPARRSSTNMPSPWRAEPKTFERRGTDPKAEHFSGPTNMLSDLNIRRYMASFNLPSFPKTPSLKDFSIPSLSSMLSNNRSHPPQQDNTSGQKRSNPIDRPNPKNGFVDSSKPRLGHDKQVGESIVPQRAETAAGPQTPEDSTSKDLQKGVTEAPNFAVKETQESRSNAPNRSSQPTQLRRTTSDQSLLLRRVTSTKSSLGDDSRWDHVQEQVNSRMKAIKDSLQDSSIKLPNLPNLPTLNLNSLRPDFTRPRAQSEAQRPMIRNDDSTTSNSIHDARGERITDDNFQNSVKKEATQGNNTASKTTCSHFDEALENLTGDLVILGGYRGSILRSAKPPHRQLWVPVKVGLNIRKVNLEVGLEPQDEENMHEQIFASGMLSHIGPVDMGRRLLKRLRSCKNAVEGLLRIHDYGYDWRLSPHLLSRRLLAFLQELPCNASDVPSSQRGATVIAHSMGGLITRHVVNRRPELFAGVIYAGVPQHCVNILGPLRNGDEVLLSSKVLTAQVNFSLRSSFLLLPEDGKCFIDKETKEEYPVDFFDVNQWKQYAWSPCIAPALPPAKPPETKGLIRSMTEVLPSMPSLPFSSRKPSASQPKFDSNTSSSPTATTTSSIFDDATADQALDPHFSPSSTAHYPSSQSTIPLPNALAYLHRTLTSTLAFKAETLHDPTLTSSNLYPPLSLLYATNTPTVAFARVSSRDGIQRSDAYDDLQFGSGDGVCLARAAMLPSGYQCVEGGKVRTERGHVGLLGDLEAVGKCLKAVIEGRRRGIGLGKPGGS